MSTNFCPYVRQISTDFNNSFTELHYCKFSSVAVKEFLQWVDIWWRYVQKLADMFIWLTVYVPCSWVWSLSRSRSISPRSRNISTLTLLASSFPRWTASSARPRSAAFSFSSACVCRTRREFSSLEMVCSCCTASYWARRDCFSVYHT